MSTVHHYKANLRDLRFNLFEFLDVGTTSLGKGPFKAMDQDMAEGALEALTELCEGEYCASFAEADRVGLKIDDEGNVTLPEALHKSLDVYYDNGWHLIGIPEHLGGFGGPPSVAMAAFELAAGANPAATFYHLGSINSGILDILATESQKKIYCKNALDRRWGGTMALTEPDAGSDVGAGRATAKHLHDDVWEIEGTKRFITNGDYDRVENIVHLVLARPEGAGPGTKGLSMFIVPKFWPDADGNPGERNGVHCANVEKKMGIKASATCEMVFGARGIPARGLLVGESHQGIRQMFKVIEYARMAVGIKSYSTLSTAYLNALAYCVDRVQGADLAEAANKKAPRVAIIRHPDVRRMLMAQKAHAEGLRALSMFTASIQDQVELLGGHGAAEATALDRLNDLLLPLVKGYGSEKCTELLVLSLQCYGGSGYVCDFPAEQYIRDQKIDSLYEGTTAIQALDLLFRKVARDGGKTLQGLMGQIQKTLEAQEGGDALAAERAALTRALQDVQGIFMAMMGKMQESLYHVGLQGTRILFALAELVVGWLLVRHAALALEKTDGAGRRDKAFYAGKVASARWFCAEVLPGLTGTRKLVERSSLALMELPDEAF